MIKSLFISFILLLLLGCPHSAPDDHTQHIKVEEISSDIKIPKSIFEKIAEEIKAENASLEPVFLFVPLKVAFQSENNQVMKAPVQITFPNGGGTVDLSKIVSGLGSYFMFFPKDQFESLPDLVHLYYISSVPVQKIENESFGLGCGRWVDLQKKFKNFQKPDFLKLNTTELRHLYASAGIYVFVFRKGNQVYLTHVKVMDSTQKKIFCPEEEVAKNG